MMRFCLLLVLLACSKKPEYEYGSVCRVENFYLAQDASGRGLEIADARRGTNLTGFSPRQPVTLTFQRGGRIRVDWKVYDSFGLDELEYQPGSPKAKVIDPLDGSVTAYPIHVEGSPPKSVTFGYLTPICSPKSLPQTCDDMTEEKLVFATYRCAEERL